MLRYSNLLISSKLLSPGLIQVFPLSCIYFVLMLLTLCCGAFAGMMFISQAAVIAKNMMGFSAAAAAAVVSLLALFNTLGRLAAGSLSDRFGAVGTLRVTFAASLFAGLLLFFCREGMEILFYFQ